MEVRFCQHNPGKGVVVRRLEEGHPEITVSIEKCIRQCSVCREMPVAAVDGKRVTAADPERLYRKIIELLQHDTTAP